PFLAGLGMMLLRERRNGIPARAGLHRALRLRLRLAAIGGVNFTLHVSLVGGRFGCIGFRSGYSGHTCSFSERPMIA
ncbi:hypothetical protein, partial [Mesorhizobium sp. B2-7-1]|uniref:hypothetical protein n=1 Tax=Mesorhizobium sp. B2-7-1 TaxID=2589909 RepID=UPI0015E2D271